MAIHVLVVDDDPVLMRLVSAQLKAAGYLVDEAADGLQALVKLKNPSYDIVILDVMMPEINGYDVCYQLRFNKNFSHLPIILLTERPQEIHNDISTRSQIAYLPKPVKIQDVFPLITKLLNQPRPPEET